MVEFFLERYNYWISIVLMLTGLYIVFSRGNLVKTLIGLNLFQTSVFIFYITLSKVAGGTAPILVGGHAEESHGPDDGAHGSGHDNGHGAEGHSTEGHSSQDHGGHHASDAQEPVIEVNQLKEALADAENLPTNNVEGSLHTIDRTILPEGAATNDLYTTEAPLESQSDLIEQTGEAGASTESISVHHDGTAGLDAGHEVAASVGDVIYSNPLPHVLILTAIVVGVATTSVGLALAVRIREAYGTIEEDELEEADQVAEFGAVVTPVKEGPVT